MPTVKLRDVAFIMIVIGSLFMSSYALYDIVINPSPKTECIDGKVYYKYRNEDFKRLTYYECEK